MSKMLFCGWKTVILLTVLTVFTVTRMSDMPPPTLS